MGGRFLKQEESGGGSWEVVDEAEARKKTRWPTTGSSMSDRRASRSVKRTTYKALEIFRTKAQVPEPGKRWFLLVSSQSHGSAFGSCRSRRTGDEDVKAS